MRFGTREWLGTVGSLLVAATAIVGGCGGSTIKNSAPEDGGGLADGGTLPPVQDGSADSASRGGTGDSGTTDSGAASEDSGRTDGGAPADDSGSSGAPPLPPDSGTNAPSTTAHNFAIQSVHLGDETTATGLPGWESIGYNLDGLDTQALDTNVCTPITGTPSEVQVDGPNGLDNSFGENIIPLLQAIDGQPSASIDSSIASGIFTVMFDIVGLDTTSTQTSLGLNGQVFGGAVFNQTPNSASATPTFTTADDWPILASSLAGAQAMTPPGTPLVPPVVSNVVFSGAYIVNGQFVNGGRVTVALPITVLGATFLLTVNDAIVTFQHSATGVASGGVIAGVIKTTDLVNGITGIAGQLSTQLCSGAELAAIQQKVEQASDMLANGTNVPGQTCDGISVGIGFDAVEIGPPAISGNPPTPAPNPCIEDAGIESDGGAVPPDAG
jgi:hypothetical protein